MARHLSAHGRHEAAFNVLLDALTYNPHGLAIHQAAWTLLVTLDRRADLVDRYLSLTRDALFYLDPHVCVRCHYRSTELLWLCPQCHEWDTFVEERIAPTPDSATFAPVDEPRTTGV
jgi:lipopolysaccharide biosynthesis regulator YciM